MLKNPVLDWGMTSFGGRIAWSDCASDNPAEWSYEDLEIFYSSGRCHHLAIALHRQSGAPIGVLMETDTEGCAENGLPVPHHVFAVTGPGLATDVRGRRRVADIIDDIAGTVGLYRPEIISFATEQAFRDAVLDRGDGCLLPVEEEDIARASGLLQERLRNFSVDYARVTAELSARMAAERQSPASRG